MLIKHAPGGISQFEDVVFAVLGDFTWKARTPDSI